MRVKPAAIYKPRGAAREVMLRRDDEVVLSGPAGTGKSRSLLEKVHLMMMRYPGSRGLIVRKTRKSLTDAGLVTFEDKVLPPNDPLRNGPTRGMRQVYRYRPVDGRVSELVVGGLDKASKIMSTEYDVIYVQEATELTEDDWESLTTRLRNNVIPYNQLLADCNPAHPTHWLKLRADRGGCVMLESRHEDNPTLWDDEKQEWTTNGKSYLKKLDALTGVRFYRLRKGLWVAAEGSVYEDVWDPAAHVIDWFYPPPEWTRYWVIDFGYTNPFCWQAWAEDDDGRLYRYREIYFSQRLVEDHARDILRACGWLYDVAAGRFDKHPDWEGEPDPLPTAVICDHDAEDRATLARYIGLETTPANKNVRAGIQAVAARMKERGDGTRGIYLLRDSLVERDPKLEEKKLPCGTDEEVEGYMWDKSTVVSVGGRDRGEYPVKKDDHGVDTMRYMVMHKDYSDVQYIKVLE